MQNPLANAGDVLHGKGQRLEILHEARPPDPGHAHVDQHAADVRREGGEDIEVRCQFATQPVHHHDGLEEQPQVGGQGDAIAGSHLHQIPHELWCLKVPQRQAAILVHRAVDITLQLLQIDLLRDRPHAQEMPDQAHCIALLDQGVGLNDIQPVRLGDIANHAEVHGADHFIRQPSLKGGRSMRDQEIAWMRVGVEESVDQHLLDNQPGGLLGYLAAVVSISIQRLQIVDLDAVDTLQDQHPLGEILPMHPRDEQVVLPREVGTKTVGVEDFPAVVQFVVQSMRELRDDLDRVIQLPPWSALGEARQVCENVKVGVHGPGNTRTLDLQDDVAAIFQSGSVHLSDGG